VTRALSSTIQSVTGSPWEGLRVDFLPEVEGYEPVSARTDAAGVFVAELETGVPYSTGLIGPMVLDGAELAGSVTVIHLTVPEGDGAITLTDAATLTLSTGWSVLLRRLVAAETAIADYGTRLAMLEALP
jgi:hypothetical protein